VRALVVDPWINTQKREVNYHRSNACLCQDLQTQNEKDSAYRLSQAVCSTRRRFRQPGSNVLAVDTNVRFRDGGCAAVGNDF
jgi:hypothetical protein